jgi:hypothetical protein
MESANTLAYYNTATVIVEKNFKVEAQWDQFNKKICDVVTLSNGA